MELIKKSVELVNKNMIMVAPFLLQLLLVGGMSLIAVFGASLWFFSKSSEGEYFGLMGGYQPLAVMALIIAVIALLVQSFVMSGTVGMGKEALKKGTTNLTDFFHYGKKYFLQVLLIELVGAVASLIAMAPMFVYLVSNIETFVVADILPLKFFVLYFACGLVAAVVYFIAHFSMIPLIKDGKGVWAAIGSSFRILPKGFKDCLVLLGVGVLVMIMFVVVSIVLAFIPILGQVLVAVIQFYTVVVLLMWSLVFYEKHSDHEKKEIDLDIEKEPIL